ncbi:conserved hypothetical protein [Uncinocarpus reesii 1704]|uniref:CCD97-like C-terminal domain-containing protein n=1 Tax=Uncinocarpus reesii (strain UAMH 1704) TaxID=336963 RepID=C4JLG9_UNCRE|nr:uncharacterized protein UREG_03677 [Uncinocarpus reesii 1704]EEP78831.1 conserved hypothetical protein [Uncinocarpus reesii 1704]
MPHFPMNTGAFAVSRQKFLPEGKEETVANPPIHPPASVQVKNRRKKYLELHPEYFSSGLELAGTLSLFFYRTQMNGRRKAAPKATLGEILAEDEDEIPETREEGQERWRSEMELRFLRGADSDFDYAAVDECDDYDDLSEEQEKYFDEEEPEWLVEKDENGEVELLGETGIQDF